MYCERATKLNEEIIMINNLCSLNVFNEQGDRNEGTDLNLQCNNKFSAGRIVFFKSDYEKSSSQAMKNCLLRHFSVVQVGGTVCNVFASNC